MRIDFEEQTHIYLINGDIASITVTSLLRKHGLAPDYSGVSKAVCDEKKKQGKEVHKDLECVLNLKDYQPTTEQGKKYAEWVEKNLDCGVAEQLLGLDYNGMIIAGTADVMGFMQDGTRIVADHKNMKSIHKESVSWQVSLYDYFARKLNGEKINGQDFNWKGATKFLCFQYYDGEMKVIGLEKVPDEEIEKLLLAEYKDEKYVRPVLVVDDDLKKEIEFAELTLMEIQEQEKIAKTRADELRAKLLEIMESQGIKSFETEKIKITYVAPIDRLSVDSTKIKKEYPEVYTKCQKLTKVKASVRVTIRGAEDEE